MAPEQTTSTDGERQKTLDREVRELITTLTNRLASIQSGHKSGAGSSSTQNPDEDENGVRVITLAGTNLGATMRGDIADDKTGGPQGLSLPEHEDFATYVNSNFQAINNSIMFGGSYSTNDPGVHLDISEYVDHHDVVPAPLPKRGNKGKKQETGGSRDEQTIMTQQS